MADKEECKDLRTPAEAESAQPIEPEGPSTGSAEEELRVTIDRLQRLQAEFENYKKRAARDAAAHEARLGDHIILDFLSLYDNLQLAFRSLESNGDHEAFATGVEKIYAQFQQLLEAKGVVRIETRGQWFDPALHQAMLSVSSDLEKNRIVEEFMPGYMRKERVLRPSMVSVSQGPQTGEEDSE